MNEGQEPLLCFEMRLSKRENGTFLIELFSNKVRVKQTQIKPENKKLWQELLTASVNKKSCLVPIQIRFNDPLQASSRFKVEGLLLE